VIETFTVVGAIGAVLAAVLAAIPLWPRQPFRLERVNDDVTVLVRTRWPAVLIRTVWVQCYGNVNARDMSGTTQLRIVKPREELFLDVADLSTGESLSVFWKPLWRYPKYNSNLMERELQQPELSGRHWVGRLR